VIINARHLQAFLILAEELHFGRAAERLHLAQPALTQTVRQLELELGVRLFDRTTRRVQLSPAGLALRDEAARALDGLQSLSELARRLAKGEAGTLRVGYMIGAGIDLMPSLFTRFSEAYPLVSVETTEYDFSDPTAGLLSGAVDAAILRPPVDEATIEIQVLAHESRVVTLPEDHPLAGRDRVAIHEILHEPIVAAPRSAGLWRDYWLAIEHRDGVPPIISAEAATREAELQAVAMGRGISITSGAAARYYLRPGIRFVEIADLEPCVVALAWRRDTPSAVVDNLREVALSLAGGSNLRPALDNSDLPINRR
jgi:DNA-binding transcriptional LysR family regulator